MAALGGDDEVVHFLPLGLSSPNEETLPDWCRNPGGVCIDPRCDPQGQRDNARAPLEVGRVKLLFA